MAPRANWKGFLCLSLVTCPVALYPATSESEKVSFNHRRARRNAVLREDAVSVLLGTRATLPGFRYAELTRVKRRTSA